MTIFTIHTPPVGEDGSKDQHLDTVLIPEATSLAALVIPFFWLLWHRQWWAILFYVMISIAAILLLTTSIGIIVAMLTFIPGLYLFLEGNELRRKKLQRNGWRDAGVVEAPDLASAEYTYFHSVLDYDQKPARAFSQSPRISKTPGYQPDAGIEMFANGELSK